MANHCYNFITFEGENVGAVKKAIDNYKNYEYFCDFVRGETGQEPLEEKDPYRYGTRWIDFYVEYVSETEINVIGESAWSPPTGMVQAFCEAFNLDGYISFEESGNNFGGCARYDANGEELEFREVPYLEWIYEDDREYFFNRIIEDYRDDAYESIDELLETIKFVSDEDKQFIISEL